MRVRWLALVAICTPFVLCGQTPPPVSHVKLTVEATHFLDSLALDAREHRIENGGCLVSYSVEDSVMTIARFGPAQYVEADSVTIKTKLPGMCGVGVPTIHSHVAWGGAVPASDVDLNTAKVRGTWNLLLQVLENGYLVRIY